MRDGTFPNESRLRIKTRPLFSISISSREMTIKSKEKYSYGVSGFERGTLAFVCWPLTN